MHINTVKLYSDIKTTDIKKHCKNISDSKHTTLEYSDKLDCRDHIIHNVIQLL